MEPFTVDLLLFLPSVFPGEPSSSTIQGTSTGILTGFWSNFCWLRDARDPLLLCCCCPLLPISMSDFDPETWLRAAEDGRVLPRGGESSWSPRGLSDGRQTALLEPLLSSSACVFLLGNLVALWDFCGLRVLALTLLVVLCSRVCFVSNLQSLYSEYKSLLRNRGSLCWVTHSQLCCLSTDYSINKYTFYTEHEKSKTIVHSWFKTIVI